MSPLTQSKKQIYLPQTIVGGGSSNKVEKERLIREGLEFFPVPVDSPVVQARVLQTEGFPPTVDQVIVAAALIANETPPVPVDSPLIGTGIFETSPQPVDAAFIRPEAKELAPTPVDSFRLSAGINETPNVPIDAPNINVKQTASEIVPVATDRVTAIVTKTPIVFPTPVDLATLNVIISSAANAVVLAGAAVTNSANALDKDADEATVTATASGVGGTTSQTVNFDFQVDFPNFMAAFGWFTDITEVYPRLTWRATSGGTAPLGQSISVTSQYRFSSTDPWTNITTKNAPFASVLDNVNAIAQVGDDWNKLDALQMRVFGTLVSGTGVGATITLGISTFNAVIYATRSI